MQIGSLLDNRLNKNNLVMDSVSNSYIKDGEGTVTGGYQEGLSLIGETPIGEGKIVFVGTRFDREMQEFLFGHYIGEKISKKLNADRGIIAYERTDGTNDYICLVNMSKNTCAFELLEGEYVDYFTNEVISKGELETCKYLILKRTGE